MKVKQVTHSKKNFSHSKKRKKMNKVLFSIQSFDWATADFLILCNMVFNLFFPPLYLPAIHQLGSTADSAWFTLILAKSAVLLSWWIAGRYLYNFENYVFEIRMLQGSKWGVACLRSRKNNLSHSIIWGVLLGMLHRINHWNLAKFSTLQSVG